MQCPSCRFENIPGQQECGRCGSNLHLATAVLDVNPPRATPWQKRVRRWLPWASVDRLGYTAREGRNAVAELLDGACIFVPEWPSLIRLAVPGWAHFFRGQKRRGQVFLGAYLGLLALGTILWGTGLGNLLLGLAFSVHASAVIDVLFQVPARIGTRIITGLGVMVALGFAIYLPAGWLATRVALPVMVQVTNPPFKEDDVLLVNQWSVPEAGKVVLYATPRAAQGPGIRFAEGQWIDRILAGPGDSVLWEKEQLIVNGRPSPFRPLNPVRMPPRLEIREVPAGHYLIFPTTVQLYGNNNNPTAANALAHALLAASLIPDSEIQGTVYFRKQPLSRWGPIH